MVAPGCATGADSDAGRNRRESTPRAPPSCLSSGRNDAEAERGSSLIRRRSPLTPACKGSASYTADQLFPPVAGQIRVRGTVGWRLAAAEAQTARPALRSVEACHFDYHPNPTIELEPGRRGFLARRTSSSKCFQRTAKQNRKGWEGFRGRRATSRCGSGTCRSHP